MFTTFKAAEGVVGTLSKPSKMPGYAYGIPAKFCPVGSVLVKTPGSVCSKCYALKGRYIFKNVKQAQLKRFHSLQDLRWVPAMVFMIKKRKCSYFRWHDSGDLQGMWHLINIIEVANQCSETQFWLPTRERKLISQYLATVGDFPENLTVRVSGTMIDGPAPEAFSHTSTVVTTGDASCPAPKQGGVCGDCRSCWDARVPNVSYGQH